MVGLSSRDAHEYDRTQIIGNEKTGNDMTGTEKTGTDMTGT